MFSYALLPGRVSIVGGDVLVLLLRAPADSSRFLWRMWPRMQQPLCALLLGGGHDRDIEKGVGEHLWPSHGTLSVQDSQAEARCWRMLKEVCNCSRYKLNIF